MPTLREVAQVVQEVRSDNGDDVGKRLHQIERILRKYHVLTDLTPQSATQMLEELGPTFVKLGQIASNRSDIIPAEYANAFKKLRADVEPMSYAEVTSTIDAAFGHPWQQTFDVLEEKPLGSASIAQVHKARIAEHPLGLAGPDGKALPLPASAVKPGTWVAVKVRRPQVAEDTLRDLALMRRAVALLGLTNAKSGTKMTLSDLVEELERTTRQEIDFRVELSNLERFHELLADQPGVESPLPYSLISGEDVLVMEFVEGPLIADTDAIRAKGWSLPELGHRIAESYVTQVVDNGFFHADPHAGNIVVRDDKIVWIDLGMVGTLTAGQRAAIMKAMTAAVENDAFMMMQSLLVATRQGSDTDYSQLLEKFSLLLERYMSESLQDINIGALLTEVLEIFRNQDISLPPEYTLLARSMLAVEGVLSDVAPHESIVKIVQSHVRRRQLSLDYLETQLREFSATLLSATESVGHLPTQASHSLEMLNRGQLKVNANVAVQERLIAALYSVCGTLCMALISAGLFVGSSMLCWTNMEPKFLGVPLLGVLGYVGAFVLGTYVVWRNIKIRHKQRNDEML